MLLKNKTVFITGASSGIGQACAEVFAEAGARLILLARRIDRINELAEFLKDKFGTEAIGFQCDVRNAAAVFKTVESLPEAWRDIDILINNAGLSRGLDKIQDGVLQNWEEMIDTNIKGLLYLTRAISPKMVERGSGMIINIASIAGREVYPNGNVYCATKHAARAISQSMQIDLNGTGVRITNIDPGMVDTEFSVVRFRGDEERAGNVYKGFEPLHGRDVAETALFCATRPPHVSIQDILVMPSAQASATIVNRDL